MTTTLVRNSQVGDDWIRQCAANVPVQRVIDPATGQPTGDILTGPVRLAFDTLFTLPQAVPGKIDNPKYGASLLFTGLADFTIFYEEYYRLCAEKFASHWDAGTQQYYGLYSPFRDQAEKLKFGGFTPGLVFMTSNSKFKPPVVDARGNPIVDQSKVYAGVWAICAVKPYTFTDQRKKGVAFGLQSVMIIGDDEKFGGGAPDTSKTFAGVAGAITAPAIAPGAVAGMPAGGAPAAPPMGGMPGAPAGGTFAAPPAGMPRIGGPTMAPGAAPGHAAPAMDPRGPAPAGFATWADYDELMG